MFSTISHSHHTQLNFILRLSAVNLLLRLSCEQVFTSIFAFECIIKLMALSKDFFLCGWNIFDLIIVSASLVDIIFELVDGLSVLRGLRLVSKLQPYIYIYSL